MTDKGDINKASKEELTDAPFVGDTMADAIVRHREEHGPFKSARDFEKVPGMSTQRIEGLKQHFNIGDDSPGDADTEAGSSRRSDVESAEDEEDEGNGGNRSRSSGGGRNSSNRRTGRERDEDPDR